MAEVYAAGWNNSYSLGLGDATQRNTHAQVAGDWLVYRHAQDGQFSLGVKSDGTLWGVGANSSKQLGLPNASYTALTQIGVATDWADVAPADSFTIALKTDGTLWATGANSYGQCATGDTTAVTAFTQISIAGVFTKIYARPGFAFAIKSDGAVYSWGDNQDGQLGLNSASSPFTTPQLVSLPAACVSLSLGNGFAMAVTADGKLYGWGYNFYTPLGLGDDTTRILPVQVGTATDWASVSCNWLASFAIKTDGRAYSCGAGNDYGTAHGDTTNRNTFAQIGSDTDWASAAACGVSVMLQKTNGAIYVAGQNGSGQLGTGATSTVTTLSALTGLPAGTLEVFGAQSASIIMATPIPPAVATAPMTLTVVNPSGVATAPMTLTMIASGTATAPMTLAMVDASDATNWTAACAIDGTDVSARLVGQASVTADEGAARIASLTLKPASGPLDPLDYVGKPITLDYVLLIGGVPVARRLFTGRVDTPVYTLATNLLQLTCVDDLQNRVAALDRSVLDSLIGGKYTEAVQGEIDDNWDYAEALLTTVAGSLDAGPHGGMRVTPWELATTWATYTEADLIYERSWYRPPQRSTMINTVNIAYEYRYPRLRQRYTTLGWSGDLISMAPCGYQYPTQQDLLGAAGGTGWQVTLGIFYPAPAAIPHSSGGFIYPDDNAIDMAILHLAQRHSQTVTEAYTITVSAPESVTLNGELPHALRGALQSEFDGGAWESALDVAPLMPSGGDQDWAPDAPRADSDYAIETLLDQARVKILGTHRGAGVGNAVLCNPDLDVDKKVAINTVADQVAGKVVSVRHILDLDSGSATSDFEIGLFGAGGAGIITPDTLAAPDAPAEAAETQDWPASIPSLHTNTYGGTVYSESLMGLLLNPPETIYVQDVPSIGDKSYPNPSYVAGSYPVQGFRVQMPGVDDADRNPLVKPSSASYSIIVPADTMTFTVP